MRSAFLVRVLCVALLVVALFPNPNAPVASRDANDGDVARAGPLARGQARSDDAPTALNATTVGYLALPDGPLPPAAPGSVETLDVLVRNDAATTWSSAGSKAVMLSYHLYDTGGKLVAWDGIRTPLPFDIGPGFAGAVPLRVVVPSLTGTYTVKPDLVREGEGWFSAAPPATPSVAVRVTAPLDAAYGKTTAPSSIIPGGEINVDVHVKNSGLAAWPAGGANPVRLGYHWFDMDSRAVVWDGMRTLLPHDVAPGEEVTLTVDMRAPDADGAYALSWDMVQEGKGWFSGGAVPMKQDVVAVGQGVTFYGKGWGHGIGLSQWGAQGWAEGAAGPRLTGEQIVTKYFPGAALATQPMTRPFRVLLSAPSTGCVRRTIYDVARTHSEGGMKLVNDADPSVVYAETGVDEPLRFVASGSTLIVTNEWSGDRVYVGEDTVTLAPKQWWDPITVDQKGLDYRGNLQIGVRDDSALRVVDFVSSDDYMRGALPGEMPSDWEMEALRAQAITARTYAAWRQATAGDRTWDVRDDTADQCYGGHSFESARTSAAVEATKSLILTYGGAPIRALYSSASGGVSENVGCLLDAERAGATWKCADGWPYLAVVEDPAELAAYDRRSSNPHESWSVSYSGAEIREQIIEDYGVDIGGYVSMEFNMSPGGRPIAVIVRGTSDAVNLKGDRFLRTTLGLKSTLVRMIRF